MSKKKEIVFAEDMTDEMMNRAIDVGKAAFNNGAPITACQKIVIQFLITTCLASFLNFGLSVLLSG